MKTESLEAFPHIRNGYHPFAVDAYISKLETKQQSLLDKIEALKVRLDEATMEAASLREQLVEVETLKVRLDEATMEAAWLREQLVEVETLKARLDESTAEAASLREQLDDVINSSPSPHAMADRMSRMLQIAVDEAAEMHAEAEALIARTEAEAETARRKQNEMLADMAAQQSALDAECQRTKKELAVELARKRAEAESAADEARQDAQRRREEILHDAKNEANRYLDQVARAVEDAKQQRIGILEQMMSLFRGLEAIPSTFDEAYQENNDRRDSVLSFPFEQEKVIGGPERTSGEEFEASCVEAG